MDWGHSIRILPPTSLPREKSGPSALQFRVSGDDKRSSSKALTNNEGNHGRSISAGGFQALDQLLHLPDLNVLLRFVRLRRAHLGRGEGDPSGKRLSPGGRSVWGREGPRETKNWACLVTPEQSVWAKAAEQR